MKFIIILWLTISTFNVVADNCQKLFEEGVGSEVQDVKSQGEGEIVKRVYQLYLQKELTPDEKKEFKALIQNNSYESVTKLEEWFKRKRKWEKIQSVFETARQKVDDALEKMSTNNSEEIKENLAKEQKNFKKVVENFIQALNEYFKIDNDIQRLLDLYLLNKKNNRK